MKHANNPAASGGSFDIVRTEEREGIGVAADDKRVNGLIELRFGWGRRCGGGFAGALFGQERRLRDGRGIGPVGLADGATSALILGCCGEFSKKSEGWVVCHQFPPYS